ncbi:MAG: excinuclease ABC subunit UvrC [Clostridiales Family XIII bacterium]|jgi:excinuclease ABC subunit C|nr:excinuclease ABC subunit UvrC [Clostridiales Family XIII bacterium]
MFDIEENLDNLPDKPGVYLHKDKFGEIIYVGKATSLRKRVRQYFRSPRGHDAKTRVLVSNISEFEYIVTDSESEALILENTLIKKYRPKFNVMLLDDKTYPYIKITMGEPFPRIIKTRILANDGSKYFGPYADVKAANNIIKLLNDIHRLKRCAQTSFPDGHRPCLYGMIGDCEKPCVDGVSAEDYMKKIDGSVNFLKGHSKDIVNGLTLEMNNASVALDFEKAAKLRDLIYYAKAVTERQKVDLLSSGSMDILIASVSGSDEAAQVSVFFVREGRLVGREVHHLESAADASKKEITEAFVNQYYINQTMLPKEILLEEHIHGEEVTAAYLSEARGSNVSFIVPERGKKRDLLKLAQKDVKETKKLMADIYHSKEEKQVDALNALLAMADIKGSLSSSNRAIRIEAYDISNTRGVDSVGAMVVYNGTVMSKKDYRKFRVRSEEGSDDYGATQEVIYRRLKRALSGDAGFLPLPELILADGGKGHVHAISQVVSALGLSIPVLGMVKDDAHRTRGLIKMQQSDADGPDGTGGGDVEISYSETDLKEFPNLYHFIGNVQEEVHRFAIEYHRGVRGKRVVTSELDAIEGVGEKRRSALLLKFGGIDAIRAASVEELMTVPGMTKRSAESVHAYFSKNPPTL